MPSTGSDFPSSSASGSTGQATGAGAVPTGGGSLSQAPSDTSTPQPDDGASGAPTAAFAGASQVEASKYPGRVTDAGFAEPSGNISCGIQDGSMVCQIQQFSYPPKPAGDCHAGGFWGNQVGLDSSGGAFFGCNGGVSSGGPVLASGSQLTVGALRCVSRPDALTCQNTVSGDGFRLSRTAFRFFHATYTGASTATSTIPTALVKRWQGHGRSATINTDGTANLVYRTYRNCGKNVAKPCDRTKGEEIISGGHIQFTLSTSSGKSSAQGNITASNDPEISVGKPVTAGVTGYNLTLSIWPTTPFCAPGTPPGKWNCGA